MDTSPYLCRFGAYSLAGAQDNKALGMLLRSPIEYGDMRLSIQREPDYFAARNPLGKSLTIIGRTEQGKAMFMCEMRELPVYMSGKPSRAVYLGPLRVAREYSRHIGVLEHGFLSLRTFARRMGFANEFFSAIPYAHTTARRIFEAGHPKLPRYAMLGDIESWLMPTQGVQPPSELPEGYTVTLATPADAKELEGLLAASGSGWSYAPAMSAGQMADLLVKARGLTAFSDMLVLRHKGMIVGCVGVWDRRAQEQVRVESYSVGTALARMFLGVTSKNLGMLPSPGNTLELAYLPFFSVRHSHAKAGGILLRLASFHAGTLGARAGVICLSEQNSLGRELGLSGRASRIRIYRILFPGKGTVGESRLFAPQPEIALL